jgi:sugar O-acyltransferase (sialic acid O-acetyltransferase NeuD family)
MRSEKMGKTAVTQENGVRAEGSHERPIGKRAGDLPEGIQRIIIVGAGGFAREVVRWAVDSWPSHIAKVAGFLADQPWQPKHLARQLPILADPRDFEPKADDGLLLAIGIPHVRRAVAEMLEHRGGRFLTLIHPTAIVAESAVIGHGSVVCPFTIVSDSCTVGRFTLMNSYSSLGHDASTGAFTVLSPYATLGGAASVADDVFLGMHAAIAPRKHVGCRSQVSANSVAMNDVPADSLVYGVPGRFAPRIDVSNSPSAEDLRPCT